MSGRSLGGAGTLTRGLELLRLLNEAYPLQVRDLHDATGLPKPTISRLLKTLRREGYVQQDSTLGYRPASKLNVLSAGVSSQAWIQEVAAPAMDRLSAAISWPSDFAVFEGRGMTLRYSTRSTAPISVSEPINTSNIPMLDSDFGRAYLAFAADEQRERVMLSLAQIDSRFDPRSPQAETVQALFAAIRHDGYATRSADYTFARANTIAVAVVVAGKSVGALNVICGRRFVRARDIPKRYLAPLQQTAAEIARVLQWDGFVVTRAATDADDITHGRDR